MVWVLLAAIVLGLVPAFIAHSKGENFAGWWFYGAALLIIALPHSILLTKEGERRFNPPPGWPPIDGSKLPLDWQPDPRWGPLPEGWQLWVYEEKKKASDGQWALAVASVAIIAIPAIVIGVHRMHAAKAAAGHDVTYKVSGASTASIDYVVAGGQQQANDVPLPWSDTEGLRALSSEARVYLSAQNGGDGSITCEIDIDGSPVVTNTSTGAYGVVTCVAPLH